MSACVCVLLLIALFVRFAIFSGCVSALRVTPGGNQVDGLPPVVNNTEAVTRTPGYFRWKIIFRTIEVFFYW